MAQKNLALVRDLRLNMDMGRIQKIQSEFIGLIDILIDWFEILFCMDLPRNWTVLTTTRKDYYRAF